MTECKKICHLTSVHIPFDTRIFHKECRSLAGAGYEVHLVACHPREETVDGIRIHPIPDRPGKLRRILFAPWDVYRQARRVQADLYHFHDPELIPIGVLLKLSGKKVIEDVHENYPGYIRSKEYVPRFLRIPVARAVGLIEHLTAGLFDAVVAVVPSIYERYAKLNPRTVYVRNFPLPDEMVSASGSRITEKTEKSATPAIAYIGNITRDRGIFEMVTVMEQVNRKRPVRLIIGGTFAPPSLKDEVERMAGFDYVDYRGFIGREEVAAVLAEARAGLVLLLPYANYLKSYSIKLFEYMSAGVPVIASDFPQWQPIVDGNGCGIMVDPDNPEAVTDAIIRILDHPDEAAEMGRRGRRAVERKYNWETEKAVLLDLYQTLLG